MNADMVNHASTTIPPNADIKPNEQKEKRKNPQ
jgi:hypothetical protein